jgi:5-methylcytosine-specific restriction endonuclease McrA
MKTCTKCGLEKDEEEFYVRDKATGQRRKDCKDCILDKDRIRRLGSDQKCTGPDCERGIWSKELSLCRAHTRQIQRGKELKPVQISKEKVVVRKPVDPNNKVCARCNIELSLDHFYTNPKGETRSYCIPCQAEYLKEYQETYEQPGRVEYFQQYYKDHKDEYAERSLNWRRDNPEQWGSYASNWAKTNPAKAAANASVRRARLRGNGVYIITTRDIRRLIQRFDGMCAYCKVRPFEDLDHIFPISRGGQHSIGNLLPACKPCNHSKFTKLLVEWKYCAS